MRQHRTEPAAIEAEITRLRSLALDALRRRWRAVFGRTPPAGLSKDLLGRMIACHLQERAFGGLDRESLRFLDGLARRYHPMSPPVCARTLSLSLLREFCRRQFAVAECTIKSSSIHCRLETGPV